MKYEKFDMCEVAVLGESKEEVARFRENCEAQNINVYGEVVWEGPVPPNSFMMVTPTMRMSTPEYFAFRKSNQLDAGSATYIVAELMSNVRTALTCHGMDPETYNDLVRLNGPRMRATEYAEYLAQVADTPEGARAIAILETAVDFVGEYECFVRENLKKVDD